VRCAKFGVQCIQDPEKPKQCACKRCAGLKEKCKQSKVENVSRPVLHRSDLYEGSGGQRLV